MYNYIMHMHVFLCRGELTEPPIPSVRDREESTGESQELPEGQYYVEKLLAQRRKVTDVPAYFIASCGLWQIIIAISLCYFANYIAILPA